MTTETDPSETVPDRRGKKRRLPKRLRHVRRHAAFGLARVAVHWIGRMDLTHAQRFGERVGTFAYWIRGVDRRRGLKQVQLALGLDEAASEALVRRMFQHFGRIAAEGAVLRRLGPGPVDDLVEADASVSHLDEALRAGRGAVLITPHLGHFDLLAAWFSRRGYQGKVVGARVSFDPYNQFLDEGRRNLGFETIFTDESPREILKVLRSNQVIGMLPDQDMDKMEGVFVPFFGRPAYTPKGPVVLARAAGAALIPAFIPWVDGRYRIIVHEPVPLVDTGDREADVVESTRRWSQVFEEFISRYPDQWPWLHRRWRTTPERVERARMKRERKIEEERSRSRTGMGESA